MPNRKQIQYNQWYRFKNKHDQNEFLIICAQQLDEGSQFMDKYMATELLMLTDHAVRYRTNDRRPPANVSSPDTDPHYLAIMWNELPETQNTNAKGAKNMDAIKKRLDQLEKDEIIAVEAAIGKAKTNIINKNKEVTAVLKAMTVVNKYSHQGVDGPIDTLTLNSVDYKSILTDKEHEQLTELDKKLRINVRKVHDKFDEIRMMLASAETLADHIVIYTQYNLLKHFGTEEPVVNDDTNEN